MSLIQQQKGYSAMESLAAIGLLSITITILTSSISYQHKAQRNLLFNANVQQLRLQILTAIGSHRAWEFTKNNNAALSCMRTYPSTCQPQADDANPTVINIYDAEGRIVVDTALPTSGFTESGRPCNDYRVQGNAACPLRALAFWKLVCNGASGCKYPEEYVTVRIVYNPGIGQPATMMGQVNIPWMSRINMAENHSPTAVCAQSNLVFVGFGKSVRGGQGQVTPSDDEGCVDAQAFQGPTGFRGFTGPRGPRGPQGPMGPSGDDPPIVLAAVETGDPMTDYCSANPEICSLYQTYFNRLPDPAGAAYWQSELASGSSLESIESNFQLIASGGGYVTEGLDKTAIWNNIAAQNGLPPSTDGWAPTCSTAIEDCSSAVAAASAQFQAIVATHCEQNPGSCYVDPGNPP